MNAESVNKDITALLRARHTLLWITSREELRVERALIDAAAGAKYEVRYWDCATGLTDALGNTVERSLNDPSAILAYIRSNKTRFVYVLRDLHKWFDPVVLRTVRSLARDLQVAAANEARAIIILTPSSEVPPELPTATVIEYPIPERAEVARILDDVLSALPKEIRENAAPNGERDKAIDSAVGLTADEIANCYARSLVTSKTIDPVLVAGEKKRVISGIPGVTWYDADPRGLDAIGGNGELKSWCLKRRSAFSKRAREYGLPSPKGVLLVGPPGTGKSLTAKCVATVFGMPLLRFDIGGTRSKFVGDSETNIRRVLKLAETVAPCVLWIDEIEKALAGASGPQGDGGVAADALGTLLSWMQEHTAPVFLVATANDVRALPPELLRKGRFDELFFVDLPTQSERVEILAATLVSHGRTANGIDMMEIARTTDGFVGAEIAALVPDALFTAFADEERALTTDDLKTAAASVVPLSKTASERITALREWAKGRARPASLPEKVDPNAVRSLDL
jgi:SpoVK/Ycf46/Vps4 family AAA+-type ATPase